MAISVMHSNLFTFRAQSWCFSFDFSNPINASSSLSIYTPFESSLYSPVLSSTLMRPVNKYCMLYYVYIIFILCMLHCMLYLVDNISVRFGGQLFRQMVGIPMGTNCAPLLADLFLYSYENEFLDKLINEGKRKLARRFNLSYRYIDDLISFNNKRFREFISDIYPKELTISETIESTSVASYLDLLFTRDRSNNITTKLYDKCDAFGFHIVNFPFMSSNIPSAPAYGVYASQLIR